MLRKPSAIAGQIFNVDLDEFVLITIGEGTGDVRLSMYLSLRILYRKN